MTALTWPQHPRTLLPCCSAASKTVSPQPTLHSLVGLNWSSELVLRVGLHLLYGVHQDPRGSSSGPRTCTPDSDLELLTLPLFQLVKAHCCAQQNLHRSTKPVDGPVTAATRRCSCSRCTAPRRFRRVPVKEVRHSRAHPMTARRLLGGGCLCVCVCGREVLQTLLRA